MRYRCQHHESPRARGRTHRPRRSFRLGSFTKHVLLAAASLAFGPSFTSGVGAQVTKVEWKNDLQFGDVWTGSIKTIQPTGSGAAHWFVEADQNTSITLALSVPSNLVSGGNTLPLSFASDAASWDHDSSSSGSTRFDPALNADVTVSSSGQVYVWLGGSISPPLGQAAGDYSGTLTLIVTTN